MPPLDEEILVWSEHWEKQEWLEPATALAELGTGGLGPL